MGELRRRINLNAYTTADAVGRVTGRGTVCPSCSHQLNISADHVYGGQWCDCPSCGWCGDAIEMAAGLWEVSAAVAAGRVAEEGCLGIGVTDVATSVLGYQARYVDRRRKILTVWREATSREAIHNPLARELMALAGAPDLHGRAWEVLTRAVGFQTGSESRPGAFGGVPDSLLVSSWDLPGRIRLLTALSRENDRLTIRPSVAAKYNRRIAQESGLAFAPLVPAGKGPLLVVTDVVAALRAHAVHLTVSETPLPLVAICGSGHKPLAWPEGKSAIFCGPGTDGLARACGRPYSPEPLRENEAAPHAWVERSVDTARVRPRIVVSADVPVGGVLPDGKVVLYDDRGTVVDGRVVCTARIWVDAVASGGGALVYRGRVGFGPKWVPFSTPARGIEKDAITWARKVVAAAGLGVVTGETSWSRRLLDVALVVSDPRLDTAPTRLGWDHARRAMVFPTFSILRDGKVGDGCAAAGSDSPGRLCLPPGRLLGERLAPVLTAYKGAESFWWITTAVLTCLLPGVDDRPTGGIYVLDGRDFTRANSMAAALGCRPAGLAGKGTAARAVASADKTLETGWPSTGPLDPVFGIGTTDAYRDWIDRETSAVVGIYSLQSPVAKARTDFATGVKVWPDAAYRTAAPAVLGEFLSWAAPRTAALMPEAKTPQKVSAWLAEWVDGMRGDFRPVETAGRRFEG